MELSARIVAPGPDFDPVAPALVAAR